MAKRDLASSFFKLHWAQSLSGEYITPQTIGRSCMFAQYNDWKILSARRLHFKMIKNYSAIKDLKFYFMMIEHVNMIAR